MRLGRGKLGVLAACGGALAALAVMAEPIARAATAAQNQTVFTAHYERNAQTEATLLATAAAAQSSGASAAALQGTVTGMNQQIAGLYAAEQALASMESNLPTGSQAVTAASLLNQRQQLQAQLLAEQEEARKYRKAKDKSQLQDVQAQRAQTMKQLKSVNDEFSHLNGSTNWTQHPMAGGLTHLQASILSLQAAAIYYTRLWIAAEHQD